jgi:hypothetical protein
MLVGMQQHTRRPLCAAEVLVFRREGRIGTKGRTNRSLVSTTQNTLPFEIQTGPAGSR